MDKSFVTITYKTADGRWQDMRHLDYMDFIDGLTDVAMSYPQEDAADLLIRIESYRQLYAAVNRLSTIQRRRLLLHFSDNLRNVQCRYEHSTWLTWLTTIISKQSIYFTFFWFKKH